MAALKEWAVVCKALEEGRQVLLLRKGGIMEYKQGFEVKHDKFLLFPTFEHQSKESIRLDYLGKFVNVIQNAPINGRNKITSYANVVEVREVNDKTLLQGLEKYHIWSNQYVNIRMNYNPKKSMKIVLLRVYKMDTPIEVAIQPEWAGCTSWIPIEFPQYNGNYGQKQHHRPAIDDLNFNRVLTEIKEVLN